MNCFCYFCCLISNGGEYIGYKKTVSILAYIRMSMITDEPLWGL